MAKHAHDPELLALKRRQLDSKLKNNHRVPAPKDGWIRASREALGMTATQLGKRLGVSRQEAADLERRERAGSITIATLANVAQALGCDLRVVFDPKTSFEETVRHQAELKAREERNRLVHTMRLEAQAEGVADVLDEKKSTEAWMTKRLGHLWD